MYKIFMSTIKFFMVVALILLGACSGCGKDKNLQPRLKLEELEKIVDIHPDPTIESERNTTKLRDHWAQEEFKHNRFHQVA